MKPIYETLYQFSQYRADINYSYHQYLLVTSRPALIHTGSCEAAKANLPEIEQILSGKDLCYVIASHFGADECGGLSVILARYPNAEVLCSEDTARQLPGFGIRANIRVVDGEKRVTGDDYDFQFVDYPSENHLRSGILACEMTRGIFFSSDLMIRAGKDNGEVETSGWKEEVSAVCSRNVPNHAALRLLKKHLSALNPKFVAVGHGYCLKLN